MGMTITEKILAAHAGRNEVQPGELINARIDLALANDITAPVAIREFNRIRGRASFRSQPDSAGPGSLYAKQGYQVGRAGQDDARVCPSLRYHPLL